MEKKLIYDIGDKPKFGQMLIFALQQVLAILAATIAVPTIIGLPAQIPAAILGAGIGTLVYQLFTKFKSPVFLGSSFAFLSSLGVALAYGYCGILLGSVVAGLVYVVIAVLIHFTGTAWVDKLWTSSYFRGLLPRLARRGYAKRARFGTYAEGGITRPFGIR